MSQATAVIAPVKNSFPSPYEQPAPAGAEGWKDLYAYNLRLPGQPPCHRGGEVLVLRQPALAHGHEALRDDRLRVRGRLPRAVQLPPAADPDRQRHRVPHPQRVRLHVAGRGRPAAHRGTRAAVHGARRALLPELGEPAGQLAHQAQGDDRRARVDRVRRAPRRDRARGRAERQGHRPRDRAARRLRPADRAGLPRLAVPLRVPEPRVRRHTSTCSCSARTSSPASPTRRSPRWCRASTWSCSAPTTSSRSSRRSLSATDWSATSPTRRMPRPCSPRSPPTPPAPRGRRRGPTPRTPGSTSPPATGSTPTTSTGATCPRRPLAFIKGYIERLQNGADIDRHVDALVAERDRITGEYAEMLERRGARDVPRQARARAHGLPVRREPQLLHRALDDGRLLAQGPAAVGRAARAGLLAAGERHVLPAPRRGARGAVRLRQRLDGRRPRDRSGLLARRGRAPSRHRRRALDRPPAAGAEHPARGHHRAVHPHAVGHHRRPDPELARRAATRPRARSRAWPPRRASPRAPPA